jgi:hypothetical protein
MTVISRVNAIQTLLAKIPQLSVDELAEVYNELFPDRPTTVTKVDSDAAAATRQVLAHMTNGIEVEEILDLWNVLFPACRSIWYDESADQLHVDENTASELSEAESTVGEL